MDFVNDLLINTLFQPVTAVLELIFRSIIVPDSTHGWYESQGEWLANCRLSSTETREFQCVMGGLADSPPDERNSHHA